MAKVLNQQFFQRPAIEVAKNLLGKVLVRKYRRRKIFLIINETEAYIGPQDLASHASKGKTKRTAAMFESGGVFYIYLIYGMYLMTNIVTDKENYPAAVLLRGGLSLDGKQITGPGRLSKFLKINKNFYGLKASPANNLWFEDWNIKPEKIFARKRVGVEYAKEWKDKPYNFLAKKFLAFKKPSIFPQSK